MKVELILTIILLMGMGYFIGQTSEDKCWEYAEENGIHSNFDMNETLISNYTYHKKEYACNFEPKIISEKEYAVYTTDEGDKK